MIVSKNYINVRVVILLYQCEPLGYHIDSVWIMALLCAFVECNFILEVGVVIKAIWFIM